MARPFLEIPDLPSALQRLLVQIPPGRVTTYRALAEALGNPVAARWVAQFVRDRAPGAACVGQREAHTMRELFDRFISERPLERLRRIQDEVSRRVVLRPVQGMPERVGGVDVAYPREDMAVAAYALVDTRSGDLIWSTTIRRPVQFPYITSYLTFREVPIYAELIDEVRAEGKLAEVVLVDGSGILHPRGVGSASHLGVVASVPTVGVTKHLLAGRFEGEGMQPGESRPVVDRGRVLGVALRPTARGRRPIFASPGHLVDLAFAEGLVRGLLRGRRLPEPLAWADHLSRTASRD